MRFRQLSEPWPSHLMRHVGCWKNYVHECTELSDKGVHMLSVFSTSIKQLAVFRVQEMRNSATGKPLSRGFPVVTMSDFSG
jgi:hypothetical protein